MDWRRDQAGRRARAVSLALLLAVGGLVGCSSQRTTAPAGQSRLEATFDGVDVEVDLPARIAVPSVGVAGEQVLLRRGYTITSSQTSAERTRVVGRPGGGRLHRRVLVEARQVGGGTRLRVEVEPSGDEAASRSILEDMMVKLGL